MIWLLVSCLQRIFHCYLIQIDSYVLEGMKSSTSQHAKDNGTPREEIHHWIRGSGLVFMWGKRSLQWSGNIWDTAFFQLQSLQSGEPAVSWERLVITLGLKQVLTVRSVPHFVHLWWLSQLSPIMWVCLKIGTPWYPQFQKDSHHFPNLNSNSRAHPIFEQSETLWKIQRIPTSGFSCRFSYQCCRNPSPLHVVDRHVSVARCSSPTPGPSWLRPPG